jgi:K+-sensing histidine kinase KdpD
VASQVPATRDLRLLAAAILGIAVVVFVYTEWLHVTNALIVGFTFLLIVLVVAAMATFWAAALVSVLAMLAFNFFFLPPVGTLYLSEAENWVALFVFLVVSLVASNLSTAARARAQEAVDRAQLVEARKAADLARQGEELKSALLASIAHNLRTPLTAIRIAASNLQSSWLSDADRHEQGDLILTEVERLNRLFQNILEMARIDAGAISTDLRWVDPSEILEAARDQVGLALRHHNLDLKIDSDVLVQVDPLLTASALTHVLENAAQYSPPESWIFVTLAVSRDGLTMGVRDQGRGIDAGDLPHLFERFYRGAESKRRVAGTGMGLSIASGLIAAEHGRIWAENCPGGGAQFTIVIPAAQKPSALEQTS